ncbi:gamma-crystallin M2-like protein [Lates japonicus]|uniref:Gamma-crystallin M2-like protein n=1 Tax=Lates japonicus TaxID=270547 RepID=A0AAD3RHJ0_LATJO|nr:gamma-crystallin M2-like protein [Lates japonicus]
MAAWKLRLHERPDFGGQMVGVPDDWSFSARHSQDARRLTPAWVTDAAWVLYDSNHKGHCTQSEASTGTATGGDSLASAPSEDHRVLTYLRCSLNQKVIQDLVRYPR